MSLLRACLDRRGPEKGPMLMGVLNVTPDSFSDGGLYLRPHDALAHVDELLDKGAEIIDIGGESTRPGSHPVLPQEQIERVDGAIRHAVDRGALVSIDTSHPDVARHAISAGAAAVNDVSCLRDGAALAQVAADAGVALIIMHAREPMNRMKGFSKYPDQGYGDVVRDVAREWKAAERTAQQAGVPPEDIFLDPGLGFNKNARQSAELISRLDELVALGWPVVVGPSRKSFLAVEVDTVPSERIGGTVAACIACAERGASMLRVHDVLEVRQALAVARAVKPNATSQQLIGEGHV